MGAARLLLAESHLLVPCWQPGRLGFLVVEVLSNMNGSVVLRCVPAGTAGCSAVCPAAPGAAGCGHIPVPAGPGGAGGPQVPVGPAAGLGSAG